MTAFLSRPTFAMPASTPARHRHWCRDQERQRCGLERAVEEAGAPGHASPCSRPAAANPERSAGFIVASLNRRGANAEAIPSRRARRICCSTTTSAAGRDAGAHGQPAVHAAADRL